MRYRKDLRFRAGDRDVRPDLVFTKQKLAVFVDGCFWHGCPSHGRTPGGQNRAYWVAKLERNSARDQLDNAALAAAGWTVIRVWEHESTQTAADRIERAVRK